LDLLNTINFYETDFYPDNYSLFSDNRFAGGNHLQYNLQQELEFRVAFLLQQLHNQCIIGRYAYAEQWHVR